MIELTKASGTLETGIPSELLKPNESLAMGVSVEQDMPSVEPDVPSATVFIVDDDQEVRESVRLLVQSVGLQVVTFSSAHQFLENYRPDLPGCLILDVRMPGMSGLELQNRLAEVGCEIPIILLTGHAEVPMAIEAMRKGAVDFIQKPHSPQNLLERVHDAIHQDARRRETHQRRQSVKQLIDTLSPREREVMQLLAHGQGTKVIAEHLGICIKTVDNHRAKVLKKMSVDNTAQLARIVAQTEQTGQV